MTETKAIRVKEETHKLLTEIKVKYGFKSYDEIIRILTDIYTSGVFDELNRIKNNLRIKSLSEVIKYLVNNYGYSRWRSGI